jgi:hypothetical protein
MQRKNERLEPNMAFHAMMRMFLVGGYPVTVLAR